MTTYVYSPDGDLMLASRPDTLWAVPCGALIYAATREQPAEYCDEEATCLVDDVPYCDDHAIAAERLADGPDPDDARDEAFDRDEDDEDDAGRYADRGDWE